MEATALMLLRAKSGSPALIDCPVLNELFPASTIPGTRFRNTGTFSYFFEFSRRRALGARRSEA
jgi:hypothetical protein